MKTKTYLSRFFEEKKIPFEIYEIKDDQGLTHFVDTEVVKECILGTGISEQLIIANTLKKLDYYNKSTSNYFKFLARVLVKKYQMG